MAEQPVSSLDPVAQIGRRSTRSAPPLILLAIVTAVAPALLHMLVPALPMLAAAFDAAPGAAHERESRP